PVASVLHPGHAKKTAVAAPEPWKVSMLAPVSLGHSHFISVSAALSPAGFRVIADQHFCIYLIMTLMLCRKNTLPPINIKHMTLERWLKVSVVKISFKKSSTNRIQGRYKYLTPL
ncbi:hypothetical protein, partial [Pseudomonas syringae]|uniref:hypothetical protein n=1 Tax=Pseudomonas syringae TaxID=317 RepID=UPI0040436BC7